MAGVRVSGIKGEEVAMDGVKREETVGVRAEEEEPMGGVKEQPMGGVKEQPMGGVKEQPMGGVKEQPMDGVKWEVTGGANRLKAERLGGGIPQSMAGGIRPKAQVGLP
jgi:hypothetical protein